MWGGKLCGIQGSSNGARQAQVSEVIAHARKVCRRAHVVPEYAHIAINND